MKSHRLNEGCPNAQQVHRELKELGYPGSDQPIVRFFAQFRKKKGARKFKQVDPVLETPVKAPPKRPTTASQVAHWITFKKEEQRKVGRPPIMCVDVIETLCKM